MITKKFTSGEPGCWQIDSSFLHEMDHLELNFACQVSTARLPFKFVRREERGQAERVRDRTGAIAAMGINVPE